MTTYNFTAFAEADLLQGKNGSSISVGDSFTMPGAATVEISVTDNDPFLSGDNRKNEQANDHSGQTASISMGGSEVGNGGQIYAEKWFALHGSDGKTYYLIEIEQENGDAPGAGDDYFTFYGDVPPAGVELCVSCCGNVCGDWVDYKCLDGGDPEPEPGCISGRFTYDADGNDNEFNDDTGTWDEGIEGATVQLIDSNGDVIAESVTDSHGNYSFEVPAGDYRVKFPAVDGKVFSAQDSGVAEHFDSDADENGLTDVVSVSAGEKIKNIDAGVKETGEIVCIEIEAEDMHLTRYKVEGNAAASGGELIKLTSSVGYAKTDFPGADGEYSIEISYVDENDGKGFIDIFVNGVFVGCISLDKNTDGNGVCDTKISTFTIDCVDLDYGDEITLKGRKNCGEYARIDKVKFCPKEPPANTGPTDDDEATTIGEDAGIVVLTNIVLNSDDVDGDTVTVLSAEGTELGADGTITLAGSNGGTFTIEADGTTSLDIGDEFQSLRDGETAVTTVSYTVTDGNGGTDESTYTVTIVGENDGPTAVDDSLTVCENETGSINLLANDTDPENDPLTVVGIEGGTIGEAFEVTTSDGRTGTVTVQADGTFSFDPGDGFLDLNDGDTDSFDLTYTIADGPEVLGSELIVNGTFEDHPSLQYGGWGLFESINGWTSPVDLIEIQEANYNTGNTAGNAVVELDANNNATIRQDLDLAEAGTYRVSVDYAPRGSNAETNGFGVRVNGVVVAEVFPTEPGFQTLTLDLDLEAGAGAIEFFGLGTSDCIGTVIDNVSMRQVVQETDTATVTVNVEGKSTEFDLSGEIITDREASQSLIYIIDSSFTTFGTFEGAATDDLNGDGSKTLIDRMLSEIADNAAGLNPDLDVHFIIGGLQGLVSSVTIKAGVIAASVAAGTFAADFGDHFRITSGDEAPLDIAQALDAAEAFIQTQIGPFGAADDQIVVLTSTDSVAFEDADGNGIPLVDPTPVLESLTNPVGINADIDVVLINPSSFANTDVLDSVDSDGINVVQANESFGLDSLIDPTPTISSGTVISVSVGGVVFPLTDESTDDGFQFTLTDILENPEDGVIVNVDTDNNGVADTTFDVTADLIDAGPDAFSFTLDISEEIVLAG